jgi:pyridoxamine 5'-phosphate oxidase
MSLRDRRVQYETEGLERGDLSDCPFAQWHAWYDQASEAGVAEPHAMTVSTIAADGGPDSRVVLARSVTTDGIVFFTNYASAKSRQIDDRPVAAAVFAWLDLHRQVRVRGIVRRVSTAESDAYFASRPRDSQVGAWASPQSEVMKDRGVLEREFAAQSERFAGSPVPRPPHWGGWVIIPSEFEFWQGRPNRLHDRFRYRLENGVWSVDRLAP